MTAKDVKQLGYDVPAKHTRIRKATLFPITVLSQKRQQLQRRRQSVRVEKISSMADKLNDTFVKAFSKGGVKNLNVLKNLARNMMNFFAIRSLIGSALSSVALSPGHNGRRHS